MASKPTSAAYSSSSMKSLYIRWARLGSNKEEWMSTHTDGCLPRKFSGNSVYGIKWNHITFIVLSLRGRVTPLSLSPCLERGPTVCEQTRVYHRGRRRATEVACIRRTSIRYTKANPATQSFFRHL